MDLQRLRAETRPEHEATEALLPLTDPNLTRERYAAVLACMHGIVSGWEQWAGAHAPPSLATVVAARRRSPLLAADLRALGQAVPATPAFGLQLDAPASDPAAFEAAFLGAMYVMEGSTLGGQYIARHVEDLFGFVPGQGNAYYRGYAEGTGAMWNAFRELLRAIPDAYSEVAIDAARAHFRYFGEGLQQCPAATPPGLAADRARDLPEGDSPGAQPPHPR